MSDTKRFAVLTLVSGEFYETLFKSSGPLMGFYADKIGADLIVDRDGGTPGYAKLKAIRNLLKKYERVLYLDADILIRHDAPSLFDLVPDTLFGAMNESRMLDRQPAKRSWQEQIGVSLPEWIEDPRYFNTGVMVVSRCHAKLFADAPVEIDNFYEQTLLNFRIFDAKTPMFRLPVEYNRIIPAVRATGRQLDDCYLSHFAGAFKNGSPVDANLAEFQAQAQRFERYSAVGVPEFPRQIYIETAGAVGDVVATEPVVRYVREVLHPTADIVVRTAWPEVFAHLGGDGRTEILPDGKTLPDLGYLRVPLMPKNAPITFNQLHPLDFAALMGLGGTLPVAHRRIKLKPERPPVPLAEYVLIHPGRSWQSKTFPAAWWNAVIAAIKQHGMWVAIIGKNLGDKGTVDVDATDCLDLRDKLTLPQLFGAIAESPILVSNDSAPVHISGAFDNWTVLIPTCKHPDYLIPHREPGRTIVLGQPLQCGPVIGEADDLFMDTCHEADLLAALPKPETVADTVARLGREVWT